MERTDRVLVLRGVACLLVVLSHSVGLVNLDFAPEWAKPLMVPSGFMAVWLFLVLSSFLLTTAFLNGRFSSTRFFYKTRMMRLLPLLYVVQGGLIVLASLALLPEELKFSLSRELNILSLNPFVPYVSKIDYSLNTPIWSVIVEIHFLLILPFTIPLLKRTRIAHYGFMLVWVAYLVSLGIREAEVFPEPYMGHFYNFGFLAVGQLLAWHKFNGMRVKSVSVIWATCAAVVVVQVASYYDMNTTLTYAPLLLAPMFYLLMLAVDTDYQARLPKSYEELFAGSLLERVGAISYSVYLTHKPILLMVLFGFGVPDTVTGWMSYVLYVAGCLVFAVVIAAFFYIEVENRFRYRQTDKSGAYPAPATA